MAVQVAETADVSGVVAMVAHIVLVADAVFEDVAMVVNVKGLLDEMLVE